MFEPKFYYKENVEIIGGFYRGAKGTIRGMDWGFFSGFTYEIEDSSSGKTYYHVKQRYIMSVDQQRKDFHKKLKDV